MQCATPHSTLTASSAADTIALKVLLKRNFNVIVDLSNEPYAPEAWNTKTDILF
jgi:hypothetical protein